MNAIGGDVFGAQGLCGGFGGREMQVGNRAGDLTVHLLGPGMIDVAAAQPRLDMADGNLAKIGSERRRQRRSRVPKDTAAVGVLAHERLAKRGEYPDERSPERQVGE